MPHYLMVANITDIGDGLPGKTRVVGPVESPNEETAIHQNRHRLLPGVEGGTSSIEVYTLMDGSVTEIDNLEEHLE